MHCDFFFDQNLFMFMQNRFTYYFATDTIFHLVENLSMSMLCFCALFNVFNRPRKNKTQRNISVYSQAFTKYIFFSLSSTIQTHNNLLKFRNSALSPVSKAYIKQKKPNTHIFKERTLQSKYEKEIYNFQSNQKPLTMRLSV